MRIFDLFRMCLKNLMKRPGRTIMTAAGIVIGTTAVIVMISLGVGLNEAFDNLMGSMGDLTKIYVYSSWTVDENGREKQVKIDQKSIETIEKIPHVTGTKATYNLYSNELTIRVGDYVYTGSVVGIDMSSIDQFGYTLSSGQFPTTDFQNTVMIGEDAIYSFYEYSDDEMLSYRDAQGNFVRPAPFDPLTADMEILPSTKMSSKDMDSDAMGMLSNGIDYEKMFDDDEKYVSEYAEPVTVSGIIKTDPMNYSSGSSIFMDINLLRQLMENYNDINEVEDPPDLYSFDSLEVNVDDVSNISAVQSLIGNSDGSSQGMGFYAYSMEDQRQQFQSFTSIIQVVLGGLAGISLLVAAIGISNTMIMSITERTKEIGVMKVLGCTIGNIRTLFLMESGGIGALGGFFGVLVSFALSSLINQLAMMYGGSGGGGEGGGGDMSMLLSGGISTIPSWLVIFALLFGIAIGLISGFYPSNRAVKISPLEAIHHD